AYYAVVAAALVAASRLDPWRSALLVPLALVPGAVAALRLVFVMKNQIGEDCLWWLALHAVNGTALLITGWGALVPLSSKNPGLGAAGDLPQSGRGLPMVAIGVFGVVVFGTLAILNGQFTAQVGRIEPGAGIVSPLAAADQVGWGGGGTVITIKG